MYLLRLAGSHAINGKRARQDSAREWRTMGHGNPGRQFPPLTVQRNMVEGQGEESVAAAIRMVDHTAAPVVSLKLQK